MERCRWSLFTLISDNRIKMKPVCLEVEFDWVRRLLSCYGHCCVRLLVAVWQSQSSLTEPLNVQICVFLLTVPGFFCRFCYQKFQLLLQGRDQERGCTARLWTDWGSQQIKFPMRSPSNPAQCWRWNSPQEQGSFCSILLFTLWPLCCWCFDFHKPPECLFSSACLSLTFIRIQREKSKCEQVLVNEKKRVDSNMERNQSQWKCYMDHNIAH